MSFFPLLLRRAVRQLLIEFVLADSGPVERVRKRPCHLSNLRRLVRRFGQALNGQRIAERRKYARADVRPGLQVLFVFGHHGQVVGCFHGDVRVTKYGLQILIGFLRRFAGMPVRGECRVQLAHFRSVFPASLNRRHPCRGQRRSGSDNGLADIQRSAADFRKCRFRFLPGVFGLSRRFVERLVRLRIVNRYCAKQLE